MVSPEAMAKMREIYAEAQEIGNRLDTMPPPECVTVVRGLLLNLCLNLREIIDAGTTHAAGIPVIDILRHTQRLMYDFRNMRSHRLH